jgi:hypothetical protein
VRPYVPRPGRVSEEMCVCMHACVRPCVCCVCVMGLNEYEEVTVYVSE